MRISRAELFNRMGISRDLVSPVSIVLESEDGTRQASIRWSDDEFSADMSECFNGETSELMYSLEGIFDPSEDAFDLKAQDRDVFDEDLDILLIASRFGRSRVSMQQIAV